jgi:hypothetical protein
VGLIKTTKANDLAAKARKARQDGQGVFCALLNFPATHPGISSEVDDWSLMVDAVEREGWQLSQWTVGQDKKGKPEAYPVFRSR